MMKYPLYSRRFLIGLFTICFICSLTSTLPGQAPSTSSGQAIPIAVMDFDGRGISEIEAAALTDRLRNELFRLGAFEVVERGLMENILAEQDFQLTGCTSNECLVEVGQLLGAKQIVGGSISKVGGTFTVSARIVDVETGRVLRVSDYDLQGDLDLLLTQGMGAVAARLADAEGTLAPGVPQFAGEPGRQAISMPAKVAKPHPWQPLVGLTPYPESLSLLLTYDLPANFRLKSIVIRPYISFGNLAQGSSDDGFNFQDSTGWYRSRNEDMVYGLLGVSAQWTTPDQSLGLKVQLGTGAGVYDYNDDYWEYQELPDTTITIDQTYDYSEGLGWTFTAGAQVSTKLPVIPALVVDTRFLLTPVLGPSMAVSLGMQLNTWQMAIIASGVLVIIIGAG